MTTTRKAGLFGLLLGLVLALGLLPGVTSTAHAAGAYDTYLVKSSDTNATLPAKVVKFNGYEWYIIRDNSTAKYNGTVTLLMKDHIGQYKFNDSEGDGRSRYSTSKLKGYLDGLTTGSGKFASVANAIKSVTLTTYKHNDSHNNTEVYETISNVKLYPLSIEEALALPDEVGKNVSIPSSVTETQYWTRSPGWRDDGAAMYVPCKPDGYFYNGGTTVQSNLFVRPALTLDLESGVVFHPDTRTFTFNIDVTGVSLDKTSTTLMVGDSEELTATISPSNATDKTVNWSSSDTDVATVDANGEVSAVSAGTATITATATNGTSATTDDKTATCSVTVNRIAGSISYEATEVDKTFGDTAFTNALTHVGDGAVTYASSNADVATVADSGEVTIAGAGNATITATVADSSKYTYAAKTAQYTLSVGKASIAPTVSLAGWTFGEQANAPSVSGNSGNGAVTYSYSGTTNGGTAYGPSADVPTQAGNYTVTATVAETGNYLGNTTEPTSFTIARAAITPTVNLEGWTYGAAPNTPGIAEGSNPGDGVVTYAYQANKAGDWTDVLPTAAGTHAVKVAIGQTDNYLGGEASQDFSIAQYPITLSVPAQGKTYGQVDASAFKTGPTDGGFALAEGSSLPQGGDELAGAIAREAAGTDAGEIAGAYDILLGTLASANPNYAISIDGAAIATDAAATTVIKADGFTINRKNVNDADVTFAIKDAAGTDGAGEAGNEFVYKKGTATTLAPVLKMSHLGEEAQFTGDANFTLGNEYQKVALGEYYAEVVGKGNFTGTRYLPWKIVKGRIEGVTANTEVAYDGKPHSIEVATTEPSADDLTIRYRIAETGDYDLEEAPAYTASGTYTTYFQLTGADYETVEGSGTLTIAKRPASVAAPSGTKVYGDPDAGLDETGVSCDALAEGDNISEAAVTRTEGETVGSYEVSVGDIVIVNGAGEDVTECYTISSRSAGEYKVEPRPITVTAKAQGKVYGELDEGNFATGAAGYEVGGRGLVGHDQLAGSLTRTAGENVGTYAISNDGITNENNGNYDITFAGANFTIGQKPLTEDMIVIAPKSFAYDGNEHAPACSLHDEGAKAPGTGITAEDYSVSGSLKGTSYNVYQVDFAGKGNYKGAVSGTWSISVVADNDSVITYDGTPKTLTPEPPEGEGPTSVLYADENGEYILDEPPSFTDAGEHPIRYRMVLAPYVPGGQPRTVEGEAVLTISPAQVVVNALPARSVYNEDIADLTNCYEIPEGQQTIHAGDDLDIAVSTTVKKGDPVGSYEGAITVSIGNPNYVLSDQSQSAAYSVTKRQVSAAVSMEGWTVGETAKDPSVTYEEGDEAATVTYEYSLADADPEAYAAEKPSAVGKYKVRANIAETANYASYTTAPAIFTIRSEAYAAAKAALEEEVEEAKKKNAEDYSVDGWNDLQDEIAAADELLKDETATEEDLTTEKEKLVAAENNTKGVEAKAAAKQALETKYNGMKDDEDYDEAGKVELKAAYDDAVAAIEASTVADTQADPQEGGAWKAEKAGEDALDAVKTKAQKDLENAKAAAKQALETKYNGMKDDDYDEAGKAELKAAYDDAVAAIEASIVADAADDVKDNGAWKAEKAGEDALDAVKTKAQKLADAKEAAKKELQDHRNDKDDKAYDQDGVNALNGAKTAGEAAIDNATDEDGITRALDDAKKNIDAVKTKKVKAVVDEIGGLPGAVGGDEPGDLTDEQKEAIKKAVKDYNDLSDEEKDRITPEEMQKLVAAVKEDAKDDLDKARNDKKDENYDEDGIAALDDIVTGGKKAVGDAEDLSGVEKALGDAQDALDAVKTKAEKLQDAKEAAKQELKKKYDDMVESGAYDEGGFDELKAAYEKAIDAIDEVISADTKDNPQAGGAWKAEQAGEDALGAVKTKAQNDRAAAQAAADKINALPAADKVTTDDKAAIEAARAAYNALTPDQKEVVDEDPSTLSWLLAAEEALAKAEEGDAPIPMAGATIAAISEQAYTAAPIEPAIEVTLDGRKLAAGIDYDVVYEGNVEVGTATVTVVGKGAYTGSASTTFKICHIADRQGFVDLSADGWYMQEGTDKGAFTGVRTLYLDFAFARGLMTGYRNDDGTYTEFGPDDDVERAQVAAILYRIAHPESKATTDLASYAPSNETGLPDVEAGAYYTAAVNWAADAGIITGYGEPGAYYAFGPHDKVTREQIATMVARFCTVYYGKPAQVVALGYPDAGSVASWAADSVAYCKAAGIMTGYTGSGLFGPQDNASRAQAAKIVAVAVRDVIEADGAPVAAQSAPAGALAVGSASL